MYVFIVAMVHKGSEVFEVIKDIESQGWLRQTDSYQDKAKLYHDSCIVRFIWPSDTPQVLPRPDDRFALFSDMYKPIK